MPGIKAAVAFGAGLVVALVVSRTVDPVYTGEIRMSLVTAPESTGDTPAVLRGLAESWILFDYVAHRESLYVEHDENDRDIMKSFSTGFPYVPGRYYVAIRSDLVELRDELGRRVSTKPAGQPIGAEYGFSWIPDETELRKRGKVRFTVSTVRDAATLLVQRVEFSFDTDRSIGVRYSDTRPARVAPVLNTLAERYVTALQSIGDSCTNAESSTVDIVTRCPILPEVQVAGPATVSGSPSRDPRYAIFFAGAGISALLSALVQLLERFLTRRHMERTG